MADDRDAWQALRARLGWPRGNDLSRAELTGAVAELGELARGRGADQLADLAAAVVQDPDGPDHLYDLGYALIDAGAPSLAASLLWRCLALVGDSEEVVCELVSALETALAYRDAFAILEEHAALRARSFLCSYLYAFNAAMIGRIDIVRAELPRLVPEAPETGFMRDTIAAIVERADRVAGACPLDDRDLRGWHYVLTGGLLMHLSPFGYDEPMRGRYALLNDSVARIASGIDRLVALLRAAPVPCVYAPVGPHHETLATAVAARLDVPLAPWPAVGTPAPGLIVAYDLADVPSTELTRLAQRRPDQILFAHASPWTRDSPVAPDVTTLLYQFFGPATFAAGELANRGGLADEDLAADEQARWDALVSRAWPLAPGVRSRLWAGGPVPSNRFD